ncbi:MAG: sulfite exporter TauE/SafE family protein, partial [Bacteroidia bacterium]|nr:sulfite exporter TauE/SafE family protein [Bacteroidia bacterium]
IVSSTLIARGRDVRYTIGSVNLAEFFITLASSITFFTFIGLQHWSIIIGLIIGGTIAAPIAAYFTSKITVRAGLITVGIVVIIVSLRNILSGIF